MVPNHIEETVELQPAKCLHRSRRQHVMNTRSRQFIQVPPTLAAPC